MKVVPDIWMGNYLDKEIDILKKLRNHRHIVNYITTEYIKDYGKGIVMELCQTTLKKQIEDAKNGIAQNKVVDLIGSIADAMKFLVLQKVLHRDIKPGNILYSNGCYKLADFGSAMIVDNFEKRIYFPDGTREYAHPSIFACMAANDINIYPKIKTFLPTCDLWSIGATIFQALVGFLPFLPKEGCREIEGAKAMLILNAMAGCGTSKSCRCFHSFIQC